MAPSTAELYKLRNLQQNFEKSEDAFLQQVGKLDEAPQIHDFYKESVASNKSLVEKLQSDAIHIFVPLKKIKRLVEHDQVDGIDLTQLKQEMITIQNNIQHLKKNSKGPLETLGKQELQFTEELKMFEAKMKEWDKPSFINARKAKPIKKPMSVTSPNNICPEVKEFMDFVSTSGGHENGWPIDDHNLFLKTRAKTKDPKKRASFLRTMLPDISESEILIHERWYDVYLELRDRQKDAIKNWRESKVREKETLPRINNAKENSKLFNINFSEMKKERLDKWKAQKRAQERMMYEVDLDIQMKQKIKEDLEREKQQKIKDKVQSWREKRQATVEAEEISRQMSEKKEREFRSQQANKLIKQYQFQDQLFMQRKHITNHGKVKSPKAKKRVEAKRDPNRLLKPTKQWLMKSYGNTHKEKKNEMHLNSIPKLRIPEWREVLKSL